jgi:hypothetical protein
MTTTSAPSGLVEVSKTDVQLTVQWNNVIGATSYEIHHKLSTDSNWIDSTSLGDVSTHTISGLTALNTYHVAVTSISSAGSSPKSTLIAVSTTAVVLTNQVTGLISTQMSDNDITITWNKLADATSYFV